MRTATKIWLLTAASLVLTGSLIFGAVMGMINWDFTKLSTGKYETSQYDINEAFRNISIKTDTADIVFALSEDGKCRVECYEEKEATHSVCVEDCTLVIKIDNRKAWYHYIGFHFGSPKITLYLPDTAYSNLSIQKSTGNIHLPKDYEFEQIDISLTAGDASCLASASGLIRIKATTGSITTTGITTKMLDLSTTTGDITISDVDCEGDVKIHVSSGEANLADVKCRNLTSTGTTGDISLNHVIAAEAFSLQRATGKVSFDGADASEIFVKTTTGGVAGSLLTDKIFITHTTTGSIDVPESAAGGRCEITTTTGSIRITIA